jgi:hypothetical protein
MLVIASSLSGCVLSHLGPDPRSRPPELVGEWIDLRHTTPADTSLWVLRADGYDGSRHLIAATSSQSQPRRTEQRYGTWYLDGTLSDPTRAICFAKRIGRDGPSCVSFSLDTIDPGGGPRRRLVVHGYKGEHHVGDEELIERTNPR